MDQRCLQLASKLPITSAGVSASDSPHIIEALQADVASIGRTLNAAATIPLTALRVVVPQSGSVAVYCVSDSTTVSTVGNYHVLKVLRSGQDEGKSYDTRNAELPAYTRIYFGTFSCCTGDLLTVSVTVTGAPVPLLSSDNICLSCELTPVTEV